MTLRHFKIYATVYTEKSMTKASKKLFMTQPSVSQVIKELEEHYQVVLFERFPKELRPTATGELLFEYASNILEMNNELEDMMKAGSSQHVLKLGTNDTVGSSHLGSLINTYSLSHPLDHISVHVNRTETLGDMLRSNDIDLAISDEFHTSPDLYAEIMEQDEYIAVVSADFPDLPKDLIADVDYLSKHRLLLREPGTDARDYAEHYFRMRGHTLTPFMDSISFDILLSNTLKGLGISLLPRHMVTELIKDETLLELTIPEYHSVRTVMLCWQKNKYISSTMEDFISLCRQNQQ